MSYGLEVYDRNSGQPTLTITDRLTRIHSRYTVSLVNTTWLSVPVSGMTTDGTWAVLVHASMISVRIRNGYFELKSVWPSESGIFVTVIRY